MNENENETKIVPMGTNEIRERYLSFFEDKGCLRMPSSSLVPDDPSLLLTAAGMVQFKPYFLHQKELADPYIGTTTVQKCVRTSDIEEIGDSRHLSFFEMLGNFSFGKYFKREMCEMALEFCLGELALPKERLYFTVFEDDDETARIWEELGVDPSHISRLGEVDNFWSAGPTGPCGPCTEIYFDQGPEIGCGSPDCAPGCDCDRFLEFWNLVFTQYDRQEDGTLAPLPTKNIDTGMGLERIAAIMQDVQSSYDTDTLRDLISIVEEKTGIAYGSDEKTDRSMRIIADHARSATFMLADGILPSNSERGYVLRRLIRRAIAHGRMLGIEGEWLADAFPVKIADLMGGTYPEICERSEHIRQALAQEESNFGRTLTSGHGYLERALADNEGTHVLPGDDAFKLHDTYGFPIELTCELAEGTGYGVDMERFEELMEEQRERARSANKKGAGAAWDLGSDTGDEVRERFGETEFVGNLTLECDSGICAIARDGVLVERADEGDKIEIFCRKTPFYAERGGQVGDTGTITCYNGAVVTVTDTRYAADGVIAHVAMVESGTLELPSIATLSVDAPRRHLIERNHSATHLLHSALQEVLGDHVEQAGSYVGPDKLRFDFTHPSPLRDSEKAEVEGIVNRIIAEGLPARVVECDIDEARESGAKALFGEKYGEVVRVVSLGDASRELCGGSHVANTAEIGMFKIASESSAGSGIRRIEAVTSEGAYEFVRLMQTELEIAASVLGCPPLAVSDRAKRMKVELQEARAKQKKAVGAMEDADMARIIASAVETGAGFFVVVSELRGLAAGGLRNAWDIIRHRVGSECAAVLGSVGDDGKVHLLAAGTQGAVDAGFDAGSLIKEIAPIVGGGGGGKPSMAQAGGKDADKIEEALERAKALLGAN